MFDSSDHEDADEIIDFVDRSCHDLFYPIFDHDHDSVVVYFSKPPIYDYLSVDKVETPQIVKALQPEPMVMSGPRCAEDGFTSDKENVKTSKDPHHSFLCIEDQSHT